MSGWTNHPCTVISQEMIENEMGYRGSKSELVSHTNSVKEQRVDGSWCKKPLHLRCTLMGFERNYQIKIPSKQLNKQNYSTLSKTSLAFGNNKLNPWFITGFADAEGCFSFTIKPDAKSKLKWRSSPLFVIKLHIKDTAILELIKNTLMVGKIRKNGINSVQYQVESFNELQVIVDHFNKYPLVTEKASDYLIFKQCFEIVKQREHLTEKGLLKLIGLKSSLNWGLSDSLKEAFPNVTLVSRPEYKFNGIPDPFWVAGFTSGDGSFHLNIRKSETKISHRVSLRFSINLNIRDAEVLKGLVSYLPQANTLNKTSTGVALQGTLNQENQYVSKSNNTVSFAITKISEISEVVIPFFEKYSIQGLKSLDFADFKKVAMMIGAKEHLTIEGLNRILEIKLNMNKHREW
uniref:LAGLIDADG homing endonuclease n=1 Tax=Macrolepiota fuliginosa TaxID=201230 RepID=A0A5Q0N3D8_9AGAR|nr:LAGLIDADG homing endonuclease [Macrolepiota fuliginosa]QFZ98749.1 LAGLIDADG homing endonuclease [Macrolepiota fuliginosa]